MKSGFSALSGSAATAGNCSPFIVSISQSGGKSGFSPLLISTPGT